MSILGRVSTRPRSEKGKDTDRQVWWRRPFTITETPLIDGSGRLLMRNVVLLGVPPGWKLTVNIHHNPDPLKHPHCHGGRFLGLILWGGYLEERRRPGEGPKFRRYRPGAVNFVDNDTYHAVRSLYRRRSITLGLIFPNIQDPGYLVGDEYKSFGRYFHEGHYAPA